MLLFGAVKMLMIKMTFSNYFYIQCVIDLKRNVLVIGTTGTETRFLSEAELPESARLTTNNPPSMKEHEEALSALGGEDVGLAKAIEESVREQRKKKGGSSSPESHSNKKSKQGK